MQFTVDHAAAHTQRGHVTRSPSFQDPPGDTTDSHGAGIPADVQPGPSGFMSVLQALKDGRRVSSAEPDDLTDREDPQNANPERAVTLKDYRLEHDGGYMRHHVRSMRALFTPMCTTLGVLPVGPHRRTVMAFSGGTAEQIDDRWEALTAQATSDRRWTGQT